MTEVLPTPRGTTPARALATRPARMAGRGDHPGTDSGPEEFAPAGAQPPGPGPRAPEYHQPRASGPEDRPTLIPGSGRMTDPEGCWPSRPPSSTCRAPTGDEAEYSGCLVYWLTDPYRLTVRGAGFPGEFDGSPRRPDCPSPNRRTLNHRLARPSSPTVCEAHREHDHEYRPLRGSCS